MDKKNTMLLTVIAVATLLVAVVGATFAYFSISNTNSTSTQVVTSKTGKVPTILINTELSNLKIFATAKDMEKGEENKTFYATTKTCGAGASCYESDAKTHKIATISVSGGDAEAKYSCTGNITVSVTGGSDLTAGDMLLNIKGLTVTDGVDSGDGDKTNVSLETLVSDGATYPVNITFTGDKTFDITADVWLVNDHEKDQSDLAGDEITTTIDTSSLTCTLLEVTGQ